MATCEELIGKTIESVDIAEDGGAIRFNVAGGDGFVYRAVGGCCSRSWVESVDDVQALVGGVVTATEDLELGREERSEDEYVKYVQFYGVKITTDKGRATVDYRNSSNGYYGGSLVLDGEQNVSACVWRRLA